MAVERGLEQQLQLLIAEYRRLQGAAAGMSVRLAEQTERLADLQEENRLLRADIDAAHGDRFALKRLKDERKLLRRKLSAALERLDALEQEVSRVLE